MFLLFFVLFGSAELCVQPQNKELVIDIKQELIPKNQTVQKYFEIFTCDKLNNTDVHHFFNSTSGIYQVQKQLCPDYCNCYSPKFAGKTMTFITYYPHFLVWKKLGVSLESIKTETDYCAMKPSSGSQWKLSKTRNTSSTMYSGSFATIHVHDRNVVQTLRTEYHSKIVETLWHGVEIKPISKRDDNWSHIGIIVVFMVCSFGLLITVVFVCHMIRI